MALSNDPEEVTETSPLLTVSNQPDQSTSIRAKRWQKQWDKITLLILLVVLLVSLGDQFQESPHTRLMESVICYRYFEEVDPSRLLLDRETVGPGAVGGVAEMLCKADDVQSELAMLRGWQLTLNGFPSLVLALPFGWAADRYGRRPFVVLGVLGYILKSVWMEVVLWFWQAFNIKVIWVSTVFASIGGGDTVTSTFLFVLLSDITPEAKRADAFLRVGAFNILAQVVMPPLGAWLMKYNPWIPALGGTALMIAALIVQSFIPETMGCQKGSSPDVTSSENESMPAATDYRSQKRTISARAYHILSKATDTTDFLWNDWRIPALLIPFVLHMVVGTIGQLILQYLSKCFALTFSDATFIMTIKSGVQVLLLFVILPYVSATLMRIFHLSAQRKDLYLVRISLGVLTTGLLLFGLSFNISLAIISLAMASLGLGFALLLRSFVASLVEVHHVARIYSIIAILETLGQMAGAPLLAGLFKRGLALGGGWNGLPFYFTGFCGFVCLIIVMGVGLRKGEDDCDRVREEQ